MNEIFVRRAVALLAFAVTACSNDGPAPARGAAKPSATHKTDDSAAGTVDLGSLAYNPVVLTAVGAVSGTIKLDGPAPVDTTRVTTDERVCGTTVHGPIEASAKGLSNAVVWIAGVTTGKPLPVEKRIFLTSEDCVLDPRVQATVVGATVNVFNDDPLPHKLVFTRAGAHDTLTALTFFNAGQVVATERLAKASGVVEVRCVQHQWTHAYIAVFDHPYFAVTEKDGAFKIDSLPPGTYTMMVWHEGMAKPAEQSVQVGPGGNAKVDLAVKAGG